MKRGVSVLLGFLLISTLTAGVQSQAHEQAGSDYFQSMVPLTMQDGTTRYLKDLNLSYELVVGHYAQEIQFDRGLENCNQGTTVQGGTTTEPISFQYRPIDKSFEPLGRWETLETWGTMDPWWGCQLASPSLGQDGVYMYHEDLYRKTNLAPDIEVRVYGETTGTEYAAAITALRGRNPINYVAMGDSYSSGEGVEPYFSDSATPEFSPVLNKCHRSQRAYSQLFHAPFSSDRMIDDALSVHFIACSGARTYNVLAGGTGQYDEPPQLAQGFVNDRTSLVTITIGGNDVGFKSALEWCTVLSCLDSWLPAPSRDPVESLRTWLSEKVQSQGFLDQLTLTLEAIRFDAPNATIVVSGYPRLFPETQVEQLTCVKLAPLAGEEDFLNYLGYQLDFAIEKAAARAGVYYNDVQVPFAGHSICGSAGEWISGYTVPDLIPNPLPGPGHLFPPLVGSGSFHPNAEGQSGYASSLGSFLERRVDAGAHLTSSGLPMNPTPTDDGFQPLRAARQPVIWRRHRRRLMSTSDGPAGSLGEARVTPVAPTTDGCSNLIFGSGEMTKVQATGFAPNSSTHVVLFEQNGSRSGTALGTLMSDANGDVGGSVQIPLDLTSPNSDLVMLDGPDAQSDGRRFAVASIALSPPFSGCDQNLPHVSVAAPADGATYAVGQPVSANYMCSDGSAGTGLASCGGTVSPGQLINTSPGPHTFEVTARDNQGSANRVRVHYNVVYSFEGFTAPVNNLPTVNLAQAGQTIPITWTLRDYAGVGVANPSSFVDVASAAVPCGENQPSDEIEWTSSATGLKYLGDGRWRYSWQTSKAYAGSCMLLRLKLADGITEGRSASFRFRT
ncbi:MAG: SGNH/GDSL hydrolase family protein [Actinomycetota bacterium]|nr:SGNH/GDSL hydrolase family protein [Actinomycetota bacterium]